LLLGDEEVIKKATGSEPVPILATNHLPPATGQATYYKINGTPMGTVKPVASGVYIMKTGKEARKIVVR
jgi:hypothetical protein